jgi:hypothetical protein
VSAVHPVHLKTTPKVQQKREKVEMRLEDESSTLGLLVTTELEVLASLESELKVVSVCSASPRVHATYLCLGLALCAL